MWSVSSSVSFFNQWHHYPAGSDITGRVSACGDVHTRPLRVTRRLMFNSVPRVYSQTEETGLLLNGELIHDVINSSLGARAPPRLQPLCYYFCWSVSRWDGETHVCVFVWKHCNWTNWKCSRAALFWLHNREDANQWINQWIEKQKFSAILLKNNNAHLF